MEKYYQYLVLCIILIIAYIYAMKFAPAVTGHCDGWKGAVNKMHESCLLGCDCAGVGGLSKRGSNYIIAGDPSINDKLQKCAVTFWGGTHFAMFALIGFMCPDLFLESFAIGIGFELYEYKVFDCHDTLDIFLNTSGFLIGKTLHKYAYGSKLEKNGGSDSFNDLF